MDATCSSLLSYLFLLLKCKKIAMRIKTNIAPPTQSPIIMAFFDFGLSSVSFVVSEVEIKGWTLKMVPPTDPPILYSLLSTMAFRTSLLTISPENP